MEHSFAQRTTRRLGSGSDEKLGAIPIEYGVNFALYSAHAEQVFLLLFDAPDGEPTDTIELEQNRETSVWHTFVYDLKPGQFYGFRVSGPYDPSRGLRFNPYKLLMDPYARALTGKFRDQDGLLYGYVQQSPDADLAPDRRDNARIVPKCIVMDDDFDWGNDRRPEIAPEERIIYEVHLRGLTAHPSSGVEHPGTYSGFVQKIPYLLELGVTSVELLPVHEFHVRDELLARGLTEYWWYNTIGFFAPESSYGTGTSPGCQVREFKTLVRELHRAGMEVILDVVYNHTGEEHELGPTLCFRGIDNPSYYVLDGPKAQQGRFYRDLTGCRNTLDIEKPAVLRLVMDSLRYWVSDMHVDGFRFDLATVLGFQGAAFTADADFFRAVQDDPVLKGVTLIAEPWDLTTRQTGRFPAGWMEWNDTFRDTVRRFIRGDEGQIGAVAHRIAGSQDLFSNGGRSACSAVNYITAHDGFTLHDLYTYEKKRNEENGEDNRDGSNNNNAFNCGVEGETDDHTVLALRKRMAKNGLSLLFLSRGTPMLLSGDEVLRTQGGNNNAYCQDNEKSWYLWNSAEEHRDILAFCRGLIALRKRFPVLHTCSFLNGQDTEAMGNPAIRWYGYDLTSPRWDDGSTRLLCCELAFRDTGEAGVNGGSYLFMIFNMSENVVTVHIPVRDGFVWHRLFDTQYEQGNDMLVEGNEDRLDPGDCYSSMPRTVTVLLGINPS